MKKDARLNYQLSVKQLRFLKQYVPSTLFSIFIAICLTLWILWDNSQSKPLLLLWFGINSAALLVRAYLHYSYIPKLELQNPRQGIFILSLTSIVSGILVGTLFYIEPNNPDIWAYFGLLIAVMVISSIVTLGAKLESFYAFLIGTVCPILIYKLWLLEEANYFHLAMIGVVLVFIINTAHRFHYGLRKVFLMEIDNQRLKNELTTETAKKELAQAGLEEKARELLYLNENLEQKVREKTQQLNVMAFYDQLTQLPNRHSFYSYFQRTLSRQLRSKSPFYLLFIDLDEFKNINDNLGHDTGDQLLVQAAERLKYSVRADDFVARVGGDEFAVILKADIGRSELSSIAEKIIAAISKPYQLADKQSYISCSIGIAAYPQDGEDIHQLVKHADMSMYQAKENGKNGFHFFNIALYEKKARRFIIENALKSAIKNNELKLVYQPQIQLPLKSQHEGQLIGMESLLRWQNEELGFVSPAEFIPIAEDSNLILELENWVIDQVISQAKQWQNLVPHPFRIAINISGIHFKQANFATYIENKLHQHQFDGSYLEIELTESSIMDNTSTSIEKLAHLKTLGIHSSIDDFGTGYSSMSYLKQLPIDKLKIDKSFIDGIPDDPQNCAIIKAIIELAKQFNLVTVAEGVEEKVQRDYLQRISCQSIQGYFYYKPLSPQEFEDTFFAICETS